MSDVRTSRIAYSERMLEAEVDEERALVRVCVVRHRDAGDDLQLAGPVVRPAHAGADDERARIALPQILEHQMHLGPHGDDLARAADPRLRRSDDRGGKTSKSATPKESDQAFTGGSIPGGSILSRRGGRSRTFGIRLGSLG